MKRQDTPDGKAARGAAPRRGRLVVSFVDRNWLWSRFGLALSLLLAVVVAALALMPLPEQVPRPAGLDKIYYFLAFMALVFPVIVTDTNRWTWAVPSAIVFGGAIELFQPMMGRNADWLDFGASISGVLAGAALAEILHNRIRRSVLGAEPDLRTNLPLSSENDRMETMRNELMAELRAVLREELEAAAQRGAVQGRSARDAAAPASGPASVVPTAAPPVTPSAGGRDPEPVPDSVAPVRVTPERLKEGTDLRRVRIALRAKDHAFEPLTDADDDDMPDMPPPAVRPAHDTQPGGGVPTRH